MADKVLERMVDQAKARNGHELLLALEQLDASRCDPFDVLVAGIDVKERGYPEVAEEIFQKLVNAHWNYAPGHYELAVVFRSSGRPKRAMDHLLEARRCSPEDFRVLIFLAHMFYAMASWPEAEAVIDSIRAADEDEQERIDALREFGVYLHDFSRGRAKYLVDEVRRNYDWIDTAQVADEIAAAIRERRGFALIRLGDGEGAFAEVDAADEARFSRLYGHIRKEWTEFLLGPEFDEEFSGYGATRRALMRVVAEADVLGVPYPSWVDHEYNISSLRGVPCTLNVHRNLLAQPPAIKPKLCDQIVHIHLHNENRIEPILRGIGKVTLITCLTGLPDLLKRRFELDEVDVIAVPREYTAPHLVDGKLAVGGDHYPYVFWDVIKQLSQPWNGRVFLVAAGTFGKFYAAFIKRNGGIALDLGSLVDGWMKLQSRAGYGDELAL